MDSPISHVGFGGGRTIELSAVGLLPAALQGLKIYELLAGAKPCDIVTRNLVVSHGSQLISYRDPLELFSRSLQQLIMESLGKKSISLETLLTKAFQC